MNDFVIIADSTCDLSLEFQEQYDIITLPCHVILPDGRDIPSPSKWTDEERNAFYTDLKKNPDAYGTSPANAAEFEAAFRKYAGEGFGILAMTISAGISGAYGFACSAKNSVLKDIPDADIRIIDSRRFGPGFGLMTVYASTLRSQGKSLSETEQWIEENKNRFHQAGWLDDLSFVAKKGRITHPKAFFGTLVGIKPIGEFDSNGLTTVIAKIKGARTALAALTDYIEKTAENPQDQIIFIAQTNRLPQAIEYKKMIEEKFHPKAIYINDVFPGCGINVGPGLMAAYYIGKPISDGLTEEKKIIDSYLSNL